VGLNLPYFFMIILNKRFNLPEADLDNSAAKRLDCSALLAFDAASAEIALASFTVAEISFVLG